MNVSETARQSYGGIVVAPHHLASEAGRRVLRDGGNAVEAMVAAASTIAVVYPHMNALGGDGFWLIRPKNGPVVGIAASGPAAGAATPAFYADKGLTEIPKRGPLAALTVAGTVSGWAKALDFSKTELGGGMALARLLEDAAYHAETGFPVAETLARNCAEKFPELKEQPGFLAHFADQGAPLTEGRKFTLPALAGTLRRLGEDGLDSFYRGALARDIAADLEAAGTPITLADLEAYSAQILTPLSIERNGATIYNMPPPTQGLASLLLLAVHNLLPKAEPESFDYVHRLVEATKAAFRVRDSKVTDPAFMDADPMQLLSASHVEALAKPILLDTAAPWPDASPRGDTVWLGAVDKDGTAVSFIQSIYWEFGSGVVLPQTGIAWQNRGVSFSLDPAAVNPLQPGRYPFHTIQPALAELPDGRVFPYGTMGGEGQPQTQAMLYTRIVDHGMDLQQAVSAPRWLLGRTWGDTTTSLRIENRFDPAVIDALRKAGHAIDPVGPFEEVMGHAGALMLHPSGLIEGASDPRCDGSAAAI